MSDYADALRAQALAREFYRATGVKLTPDQSHELRAAIDRSLAAGGPGFDAFVKAVQAFMPRPDYGALAARLRERAG